MSNSQTDSKRQAPTLSTVMQGEFSILSYQLLDAERQPAQFSPLFSGASASPSRRQFYFAFGNLSALARQLCEYKQSLAQGALLGDSACRYAVSVTPLKVELSALQISNTPEQYTNGDQKRVFAEAELLSARLPAAVWNWQDDDEAWLISQAVHEFARFEKLSSYVIEIEQLIGGHWRLYRDAELLQEGRWGDL